MPPLAACRDIIVDTPFQPARHITSRPHSRSLQFTLFYVTITLIQAATGVNTESSYEQPTHAIRIVSSIGITTINIDYFFDAATYFAKEPTYADAQRYYVYGAINCRHAWHSGNEQQ